MVSLEADQPFMARAAGGIIVNAGLAIAAIQSAGSWQTPLRARDRQD